MSAGLKIHVIAAFFAPITCACGSDEVPPPTVNVSASPTTVRTEAGCPGPVHNECTVTLTITVENFDLLPPGPETQSGLHTAHEGEGEETGVHEGHYHVYLDTTEINPIWQDYVSPVMVPVLTSTAGPHELIVRLNSVDHKIVKPEVTDRVTITAN